MGRFFVGVALGSFQAPNTAPFLLFLECDGVQRPKSTNGARQQVVCNIRSERIGASSGEHDALRISAFGGKADTKSFAGGVRL